MMRRYPAYRVTGVDWLGEVPEGWEVRPFRQLTSRIESGTSVNAVDAPALDGEIAVLKTSCVYAGAFDPNENKVVVPDEIDRVACPLRPDSLIVSRMNTPDLVGAAGHVTDALPNIFLPDRLWQITFKGLMTRFAYFFTLSPLYRDQVRIACAGTSSSMQNLAQDDFKSFLIPLPPLAEQTAIAGFLDRETGKIDALVAEQRRLIELLREKRQATISHAVTRGLNPAAPLKPSGVDWLGDVPEGWEVVRLKNLTSEVTVGIVVEPSKYYVEEGVPALRSLNVKPGQIVADNLVYISAEANELHRKSMLRSGDLVAVRTGQPGTCAVIGEEFDGVNCIDLIIIRQPHATTSEFLFWFLCSDFALRQFSEGSGGAIQQHFNVGTATQLLIVVPPLDQQSEIVAFLAQQTAQLDSLITTAETAISLLLERRAALISAAVTGKIDVREGAPA